MIEANPFATNIWRVISSRTDRGAWNMALDEAILESCARKASPPTLRLYSWQPPCLSLGYAQPISDVDMEALKRAGWDLVRRPTGGRAILHTDELTYAVIGPLDEPRLIGGVLESYQRLSQALIAALQLIGIEAGAHQQLGKPGPGRAPGPVCFEVPSNYEITALGKKLIGSAQARRLGGVLQHGSLPLHGDLTRITQVLTFTSEEERRTASVRLLEHATTAECVLGQSLSWEAAAQAFIQGFQTVFPIQLEQAEPTPEELRRAEALMKLKYETDQWNHRI